MTTEEMIDVIRQCQDLGVAIINFVGREPLLRKDILELIKAVDKKRSISVMYTNGYFLEEYADKLRKAGLDNIAVSIDSHIPARHDSIKKVKGIFERAVKGIKACKKAGLTVAISCCIDEKSVKDGTLVNIIELGKRLKVNEVLVYDAKPVGAFSCRKDLFYEKGWIQDTIDIAQKYNQKYDYPGIYNYAYLRTYKSLGCGGGTTYFAISPYGDVCPCDFNKTSFGNILKKPLYLIWDKISTNPDLCKASWNGCRLKDPKINKKCF
jgi:MoaA/NifB/PqqE/SkfB family radical SAM enzyme